MAPAEKPVTVKTAGLPGDAGFEDESSEPLEQLALTVTAVVGPVGEYTFETVNVADRWVFVIVHGALPPFVSETFEQLSDSVYPAGTAASLAEQVAPAEKPVTVNTAGLPGEAFFGVASIVPLLQVALTETAVVGPVGE